MLVYYRPRTPSRSLSRFYSTMVGPGDLVFDIGAHVGNRIRACLRLGARVVAVEPHPGCMDVLRWLYGHDRRVTLVDKAVGPEAGPRTLWTSLSNPSVSSLAMEWIQTVQQTEGFAGVRWDQPIQVAVTTLDALVAEYGVPAFCKIDAEGYELGILQGLTQGLPMLSFEYTPAAREASLACLERLGELGPYEYNWSVGETARFASSRWLSPPQMADILNRIPPESRSGDVYARRQSPLSPP
jgi:FkbM family methyltransferase